MDHFLKNIGGVTLKSLLENPSLLQPPPALPAAVCRCRTPNISDDGDTTLRESDLDKKPKDVEGDYFASADFGAAFLGPNLWDRTYGDDDFKLEYMELDEFLSENGLPVTTSEPILNKEQSNVEGEPSVKESTVTCTTEENPATTPSVEREPSPVQMHVNFDLSATDIALATAPGQEVYDPRTRTFTDEELKPQPLIKKSRKVYVPLDAKDDKYWDRRKKNNIAAKRSRDARRIKENQIGMRASFLEKENKALQSELMSLKRENSNLTSVIKMYEQKLGIQ